MSKKQTKNDSNLVIVEIKVKIKTIIENYIMYKST